MDTTRDETVAERYDRNWLDLMQEPRVAQTGLTLVAVAGLLFSVVVGTSAGVIAGVVVLVFYGLVRVALPMSLLRQAGRS